VVLACCVIVVGVLGVLFAHQATADWFDHAADSPFITWAGSHRGVAVWLTGLGSLIPAAAWTAAIAAACLLASRLNGAVLAVAAVPVADVLVEDLFKPLVHRTYLGAVVYPSGHTTTIVTLAATVTVLLAIPPRPARARVLQGLVVSVAWLLAGVVAAALIGLQWHYFTDTVAGAAVGIGTVCGLALLLDLPAARRWLAWVCRTPARQPRSHDLVGHDRPDDPPPGPADRLIRHSLRSAPATAPRSWPPCATSPRRS
jgi:membrane-associated phospholipid phosphatase